MADDIGEDYVDRRDYTYPGFAAFFEGDSEWAERYDALAEHVLRQDGELSRLTRELIIVAFAASDGRLDACVNHMSAAEQYGATRAQLHQTVQLAAHVGGAWSMVTGAKALEELDDLE
jgi:alkylhydroperoxidase/carboxymuconolactone decarboxylase family protein YurZ